MQNEDYLWNKTGSDSEVERLEEVLAVFRHRESDVPALPEVAKPRRGWLSWGFPRFAIAAAAFAALILISIAGWVQLSRDDASGAVASVDVVQPVVDGAFPKPGALPAKIPAVTQKRVEKKIVTNWKTGTPTRQSNATAHALDTKRATPKFSKEELYAYNQLMLALEITGAKLRLVRDKVETEDRPGSDRSDSR